MKIRPSFVNCLLLLVVLVVLVVLTPPAWSQCTDGDQDGFFVETGCGTPQDCNDDEASSYPGGVELCDGYDNDCDGLLDNDAACDRSCASPELAGEEVSLWTGFAQARPSIAWSGAGYGVVYWDNIDAVVLRLLDLHGQPVGAPVEVYSATGDTPAIVWTGLAYGVAQASGSGGIYFSRLDASGAFLTQGVLVTDSDTTLLLDLVWTGSEYALTWVDQGNAEVYFARLDATGAKIGSDVRVTDATGSSHDPSLVWTGTEYGLAWHDDRDGNDEIYFCRLDATGAKIGADVRVTVDASQSAAPSLAWKGSEYGLVWQDDRNGDWEIYFARLSSAGVKTGGDVQVAAATSVRPALRWAGAEYGLVWEQQLATVGQIYFARLDAVGTKIGADLQVSDPVAPQWSTVPAALAWTGTEYAVSWRTTDWEVRFRRIGCDCVDEDGDGLSSCDDCDDSNPNCTTDCTDIDQDSYCVTHDCNDAHAACTTDCTDVDQDGLAICAGDCDDGNPNCMTDCTDGDGDGFCLTHDCDDTLFACNSDCSDSDEDALPACAGDCDDTNPNCTTDCTDVDQDGYCVTTDCDDAKPLCALDCTDIDQDGNCADQDCDDTKPYCTTDCTDLDADDHCAGLDCDDGNANCTSDCTDADYDTYCVTTDCDDGNEFCSTDCTDVDGDGYCTTGDCDDTLPYCATDCTDVDQDGYCVGLDCDDTLPSVHQCDRACDVPGRLGEERYIARGVYPSLEWQSVDGHYGLAYQTGVSLVNDMAFARFHSTGGATIYDILPEVQWVCGVKGGPSLAWNGSSYGIAWGWKTECEDYWSELHFRRLYRWGEGDTDPVSVTGIYSGNSNRPSLVWAQTNYGIAWNDSRNGGSVRFARLDTQGYLVGADLIVSEITDHAVEPSLVWTGSEFGVAWENWHDGHADIVFARIDAAGAKIGSNVIVAGGSHDSLAPSVVWDGSGYGIAWHDDREGDSQIYFARLDATGNKIGADERITTTPQASAFVALAWTGDEYGLCWSDSRSGSSDIYFASVDAAGNKLDRDLRVSYLSSTSEQCDIVWGGTVFGDPEYGVAWRGDGDISFTRIGCDCPDGDGDGSSVCMDCDDTTASCILDCADNDGDGLRLCTGDCDDTTPYCTTDCTDADSDGFCVIHDCDEANPDCNLDCSDDDGDGLRLCTGDCDDDNPNCITDCSDADGDAFCVTHDCDDTKPLCTIDCTDDDGDEVCTTPDCNPGEVCDNCPLDVNPSQSDHDSDGEGDPCDDDDGLIYLFFTDANGVNWDPEAGFDSWNCYAGDLSVLRSVGTYTQQPGSNPLATRDCDLATPFVAHTLALAPGEATFMLVTGVSEGVESDLGTDSEDTPRPNDAPCLP